MIESLFTNLNQAMEENFLIAVGAAFGWGVLTILLSPCNLTSIPLVVAFLSGQKSNRGRFKSALVFSGGIFVSIAVIGMLISLIGTVLTGFEGVFKYLLAGVFIIFGLVMLDVFQIPSLVSFDQENKKRTAAAVFATGFLLGLALGPCTFAFMAPVLAVAMKLAAADVLNGIVLISAYAVGYCVLILLAGTFSGAVGKYLNFNNKTHIAEIIKKTFGVFLVIIGLFLVYRA